MSKKKTHEQYIKDLAVVNPTVEVVGRYVDSRTKILYRCKVDFHEWKVRPDVFMRGHRCPICSGHIKTHDIHVRELAIKHPHIEVIGKYINATTKISYRCKIHSHEWNVTPKYVLLSKGCPKCGTLSSAEAHVKPYKQYIKKLAIKHPNIEIIGKYVDSSTKTLHRCKIHSYEWSTAPRNLLLSKGCVLCSGHIKTHERYIKELSIKNPNIEVLGIYVKNNINIQHKCKIHLHEFSARPNNLLSGRGCPECGREKTDNANRKTHDQFALELFQINPNVTLLGKYTIGTNKILVKCNKCSHENLVEACSLLSGVGCNVCKGGVKYTHKQFMEKI